MAVKKKTVKHQKPKKREVSYHLIEECKALAGRGLSYDQIADYLEIAPMTFHRMIAREPKLHAALTGGLAKVVGELAGLLVTKAREGNIPALIFYLKTKGRFKEREENNTTPETAKTTYTIKTTDPIEAARIYQQIMAGS